MTCSDVECERPVNSRGMCHMHYVRWLNEHRDEIRPKRSPTCTVEGCENPHHANGLCSPHAHRLERYGNPLVVIGKGHGKRPPKRDMAERFWEKVDKSGDCWLWTAKREKAGYGRFWADDHSVLAHRVAYELTVGPIPDGLHIDHLCRNRGCVNPAHLEAVPQLVNNQRAYASKTHCVNGHEYTPENTYNYYRKGQPQRMCRICIQAASRRAQLKRKSG